jgi:hypothetical protein
MESVTLIQKEFSDGLIVSLGLGGDAGRDGWRALRQKWLAQNKRAALADLDLSGRDLRGYDFSRCWIGRVSFASANVSGCDFSQSIFRECDFTRANIRGANFYAADLRHERNRLVHTRFDNDTNMEVNPGQLAPQMDQALIDMAEGAWRRTKWFRRRASSPVYRALLFLTDHGFGVWRILAAALATVIVFAGIYSWLAPSSAGFAAVLVSAHYFLGLANAFNANQPVLAGIGVFEAFLGIVFLAILISVFTSKFTTLE